MVTVPVSEQLIDQAIAYIQTATAGELRSICQFGPESEAELHFQSLYRLVFDQNARLRSDQFWFPYEVVERGRWSLMAGHEREFTICNLVVLVNILLNSDFCNLAGSMFEKLADDYEQLPIFEKDLILDLLLMADEYQGD